MPAELVVEAAEAFARWFKERAVRWEDRGGVRVKTRIAGTAAEIASLMKEIVVRDPDAGAAFNMCSAVAPYWDVWESDGAREAGEDPRPYNVLKDVEQSCGQYKDKAALSIAAVLEGDSDLLEGNG